jgi:hypothetical protein
VIYSTIGKQWGINVDRGASNIDVFDNHIDKNYIGIILGLNKSPDGKNVNNIYLKNNETTNTIDRDYVQKYVDTEDNLKMQEELLAARDDLQDFVDYISLSEREDK